MSNPHGEHVWYELITPDPDASQRFYESVHGWTVKPSGQGDMDYRLAAAPDGDDVAGIMKQPEGMPGGATWIGYIGVDDVDAAAEKIIAAGGTMHMPPTTMDGVGRMAMLSDPQNAMFYVMRGESSDASRAFCQGSGNEAFPGHFVWNELTAEDRDAALAFYQGQFGWTQDGAMPMGDLGEYRFIRGPRVMLGALMGTLSGAPAGWIYYVETTDIDGAVERLTQGGGSVVQGPDEIPGGSYSVVATDPHGAVFGVVGPRVGTGA
jgi:predicted enzyme related to lactoylglutathione lyase